MKLEQVGDQCFAVINGKNRLCDSNSGLINLGDGVVIDTQCDLRHARRMIELFGGVWRGRPRQVVITHEDPDHVWGNQLFPDARIIAHRKIHERLPHTSDPRNLQRLQKAARHWFSRSVMRLTNPAMLALARQLAEDYDFEGIELVLPDTLFDERYELDLDGTHVEIIHVGPAHQWGDTMIHVPSQRVLFAGDVVFRLCTPMGWAGTFANWQRALDLILELEPAVIVPGHGPVCGLEGPRELKSYLSYVQVEAKACFDRGMSAVEAARRIDFGPYAEWNSPARLSFNVERAYREFRGDPFDAPWDIGKVFGSIYALAKARGIEGTF